MEAKGKRLMGKIVLFMGASSSGKDTIQQYILNKNSYNFKNIVMHTTRPKRTHEENGREYYFCSEEEMLQLQKERKIVEKRKYNTEFGPWYYFTTSMNIDLQNHNYLGSNTLEGLDEYLKYYREDQIVSLLFFVDDRIRLQRALEREKRQENPKYQEMCRRFLADSVDFSWENIEKRNIDAMISNNGTIEETVKNVEKVLKLHL